MSRRRWFQFVLSVGLSLAAVLMVIAVLPVRSAVPHLGYGFNLYSDIQKMLEMGFDWMRAFPGDNLAVYPDAINIMFRFPATYSDTLNLTAFGDDVYATALENKDYIEAYEIGNEVNIDNPDYGWGDVPVNAEDYKKLLCEAYTRIKQADPMAIVVSAGLAPTGRVEGTWKDANGHVHNGHNGRYQDDREYLKELLAADGGACLDAVGYHPYGFLADYDVAPDVVNQGTSALEDPRACPNGFCFRGAEKIYEIMQQQGLGDKKVWATELGWITRPPDECLSDPTWGGRKWQIVSDEKQAENLVGAFQYADANWPWMGAMFVFNLDFSQNPALPLCEQMRYYSIIGKPAEPALKVMTKSKASLTGKLNVENATLTILVVSDTQPLTWTPTLNLMNAGWQPLQYTITVDTGASVVPLVANPTGTLSATAQMPISLSVPVFSRTVGLYTGTLAIDWYAAGAGNKLRSVLLTMLVLTDVQQIYLPLIVH
jgi:hypothetical protein